MIVFTGEDVEYSNRDAKRYDGVYYALILNSVLSSDGINYLCYVYIPEIFGDVDNSKGRLYYRCYDYVRVLVPDVSDDCDISDEDKERNKPSTGKIIKVAFDDGNINSCRYISSIPIDEIYERMNYNYITKGILPTDIVQNIDDENMLEVIRPLIAVGNYITTGYDKPPAECYKYKFYWSNVNGGKSDLSVFRNWFIEALTMPLQSLGGKETQFAFNYYPYYSTNIYNLLYVLKSVIDGDKYSKLAELYTKLPTRENGFNSLDSVFSLSFDTKKSQLKDDKDKAKVASLWLLGLFTGSAIDGGVSDIDVLLANIAFPELTAEHLKPGLINEASAPSMVHSSDAELLWEFESYSRAYDNDKSLKPLKAYRMYNILANDEVKEAYEKHYQSVLCSWMSGLNNKVKDDKDSKFKKVILMCLTIAPWFANPLLLYGSQSSDAVKAMLKFIDSMRNSDEYSHIMQVFKSFVEKDTGNKEYNSIFPNQDAYFDFNEKMTKLINEGDIKAFIDEFETQTKKYLGKVYKDDIDFIGVDICANNQISAKFDRLRDRAKTEGWLS